MYNLHYEYFPFPPGLEIPRGDFKPVELSVGKEHLVGFEVSQNLSVKPNFVYIHGAHSGVKERVLSFAKPIVETSAGILAFDHSGNGQSSGKHSDSSLLKRELEAKAMIHTFAKKPLVVCGSSMGGYTAISMLRYFNLDTLVLLCPAIYDRAAHDVQFGPKFTQVLHNTKNFDNSDVGELLQRFTGKLLMFMGNHDSVIPHQVVEYIDVHTPRASKKEIITIEECPHKIPGWLRSHPNIARELGDKIVEYL